MQEVAAEEVFTAAGCREGEQEQPQKSRRGGGGEPGRFSPGDGQ